MNLKNCVPGLLFSFYLVGSFFCKMVVIPIPEDIYIFMYSTCTNEPPLSYVAEIRLTCESRLCDPNFLCQNEEISCGLFPSIIKLNLMSLST